jgi:hypothetical protein
MLALGFELEQARRVALSESAIDFAKVGGNSRYQRFIRN